MHERLLASYTPLEQSIVIRFGGLDEVIDGRWHILHCFRSGYWFKF